MKCPSCQSPEDKVLESRTIQTGDIIRRRRECTICQFRFTTYERVEEKPLLVIKKNGKKELFNHQKLLKGLIRAFEKRPVMHEKIESITYEIEGYLKNIGIYELASEDIGRLTLEKIYYIDQVAYIRFASVYKKFKNIQEFKEIVNDIQEIEQAYKSDLTGGEINEHGSSIENILSK